MYYVYVAGYGSATGGYYLTIAEEAGHMSPPASSSGTNCESAVVVHQTGTSPTYNTAEGQVYSSFCGLHTSGPTFWFKFTPSHSDTYIISTCNSATTMDTVLAVSSGSCDSLTCVATNDDHSCSSNSYSSTVYVDFTANRSYYITVSGYGSAVGDFVLTIERD
jgi:hypothetical protein